MTDPADGGARGSETEGLAEVKWRLDHYGPFDAEPFQFSRFESPAHAALDGILAAGWRSPAEVDRLLTAARDEALRDAAHALLIDCAHFNRYRGKPEWCGYCESAADLLTARADSIAATEGEEDYGPGCDCTELCEMGPTCPGGMLAGLEGAGCWRTDTPPTLPVVSAEAVEALAAEAAALGRRATLDPGAFVKRGPDNDGEPYGESLDRWQKRAIDAAVATLLGSGSADGGVG